MRRDSVDVPAFLVDLHAVMKRSEASLYSHLVTRPTGRAVRMAIETQLEELRGPALSLVDLSQVSILDYSCADEIVAQLLLRHGGDQRTIHFLLRGVRDHHRDPIEAVLERHALAVVAETSPRRFELLGTRSEAEWGLWTLIEERGRIDPAELLSLVTDPALLATSSELLRRGLLYRDPTRGILHALSGLAFPAEG